MATTDEASATSVVDSKVNMQTSLNNNNIGDVERSPPDAQVESRWFTKSEVADHSDNSSCWIVINDQVYDVTKFLKEHPGGWEVIMERAGADSTYAFESKGHSDEAIELLKTFKIGQLKKDQTGKG